MTLPILQPEQPAMTNPMHGNAVLVDCGFWLTCEGNYANLVAAFHLLFG
jgi:hypothetical protein